MGVSGGRVGVVVRVLLRRRLILGVGGHGERFACECDDMARVRGVQQLCCVAMG